MHRREAITLIGGAAVVWPLKALAQSDRVRRIGVLMGNPENDPQAQVNAKAMRQGLQNLGWIDGQNVTIDYRWAGGDPEKARAFAKELVAMAPDVIVPSSNQVTAILRQETSSIPIVFVFVGDPVGSGFAASLAKPGGNSTGFAVFENSIGGKWLELLNEVAPGVKRVGFVYHPDAAPNVGFYRAAVAAAPALGIEVVPLPVHNAAEIESGVATLAQPNCGLNVVPHAVTVGNRDLIVGLAARHRLPAVYSDRSFAESGGLLSFGTNIAEMFQRSASYVDRIFKGAKPADLPVQLPTKYELIINLKTAKELGLHVPSMMLTRADEVIE
jgi:putative ABC transport system substrate-binding protein